MNILVFSQYFYPENFRINTLCRELVLRGNRVTVVTGYPQYPLGEIYEGYGFDIPYETKWNGVNIVRVRVHPRGHGLPGMLRNTVDYVVQAEKWVKQCREKFDAVYVFEVSPVTVGLPAVAYKKKFGVPMFFNLQDLWPENVEEVLGIRFAPLTWLINRIVDRIYNASNKILCTSNGFADNLRRRGVAEEKIVFWPQFCLEPDLKDAEKPEIYGADTFNIVFAGNLGDAQGLDLMVEAARELKGCGIRWYLVGDGRARARLEQKVWDCGVTEEVTFVGRVSEQEADRYVHFADCAYLSFQDNKIFNMTLPAKLQTYLACGTPILAAAGGESARLVGENGIGFVCRPQLDALVHTVKQASAMTGQQHDSMAAAARDYYETHFTMDRLVSFLEEMLREEIEKQER
ncbi:MAG: glycosyltransferase family 4 protein [Faecousia sp.]